MVDPEDLKAVREVLAGRTDRFSDIVRRYQRLVGSLAYRMGVASEDAEDVVSEIFIKVYENLGRFRPDHALSTWIYRIACNHVLDYQRRRRRERFRSELSEKIPDPAPPPSTDAARSELAQRVRKLLPLLDEKYRTVLVLLHVEGLKVQEISHALGIPEGTVKTRLARGRERLAAIIRAQDPDLLDAEVVP